jgi:hypothetical protein
MCRWVSPDCHTVPDPSGQPPALKIQPQCPYCGYWELERYGAKWFCPGCHHDFLAFTEFDKRLLRPLRITADG